MHVYAHIHIHAGIHIKLYLWLQSPPNLPKKLLLIKKQRQKIKVKEMKQGEEFHSYGTYLPHVDQGTTNTSSLVCIQGSFILR